MKKLRKINLRDLSQAEMQKKTMGMIKGGMHYCICSESCTCPCKYAGDKEGPNDSYYGGSSTLDNMNANNISRDQSNSFNIMAL